MQVQLCPNSENIGENTLTKVTTLLISWRNFNIHQHKCEQLNEILTLFQHGFRGRPFVGPVGKAYVDVMCRDQEKSCSVVVDNVDAPAAMTASIVAHEMGHNFGMKHDQDHETPCDCQTPDKGCVMTKMIRFVKPWHFIFSSKRIIKNVSFSVPTTHWSSCSKTTMQHFLRGDTSACIRNKPTMYANNGLRVAIHSLD